MKLLEKLSNLDAISSSEEEIRSFLKEELEKYSDEVMMDGLGSIIFKLGSNDNKKIMIDAHMDEVGFIVKNIYNNGKIILKEIGNVIEECKYNERGRITTSNGDKIYGIINKEKNELYMDLGIESEEEVKKLGIQIGDMVCFSTNFMKYSNEIVEGKALDNRVGCYILIKLLKKLSLKKINSTIYFVFSSSEEVGMRGSKTATNLINPDIAFVIDVVSNKQLFNTTNSNTRQNGKGFLIELYDKTFIPNKKMINLLKDTADKCKEKYQLDFMNGGGTNAGVIHLNSNGVPCIVTAIPLRYCHGSHSLVNIKDIESLINVYEKILSEI